VAFECKEYSTTNKSYIFWIMGFPIALREFLQAIVFFVMISMAFNFGYQGNSQVVMLASQLCTEGIYDHTTGMWTKCYPHSNGLVLEWSCINNTNGTPFADPFPNALTRSAYR